MWLRWGSENTNGTRDNLDLHRSWERLGYPFASLTPSLATARTELIPGSGTFCAAGPWECIWFSKPTRCNGWAYTRRPI